MAELERVTRYTESSASVMNSWADEIERVVRGVFSDLDTDRKPVVRVEKTSGWTLGSGGGETISWDAAAIDPGDMWDAAEPSRVTIRAAGSWLFVCQVKFSDDSSSGVRGVYLTRNGEDTQGDSQAGFEQDAGSTNSGNIIQVVSTRRMVEGDQIYLRAYQDSGNDTFSMDTDYGGTYLSGVWLGP